MRVVLTNLSLVVLQLLFSSFFLPESPKSKQRPYLANEDWEQNVDFVKYAIQDAQSLNCRSDECSLEKLETAKWLDESLDFTPIINSRYEFLSYDIVREQSVFKIADSTRDKQIPKKSSESHIVVLDITLLSSFERLDFVAECDIERSRNLRFRFDLEKNRVESRAHERAEILDIISNYINLPPPKV